MTWFDPTELETLKLQHTLAIDEMIQAIDKANDLKCQIWAIEAERDKNEPEPIKDRCPYCKKPMAWDQFKEIWICRVHGKFDEGILP